MYRKLKIVENIDNFFLSCSKIKRGWPAVFVQITTWLSASFSSKLIFLRFMLKLIITAKYIVFVSNNIYFQVNLIPIKQSFLRQP